MQGARSLPLFPPLVKADASEDLEEASTSPDRHAKKSFVLPGVQGRELQSSASDARFEEFLLRQSNSSQNVRLELAKMQRDSLEKMRQESASSKFHGSGQFKMLLRHRYGSLTAAWRQLLDPTNSGKVSRAEFCVCCRDLGFQRKTKQLWAELDIEKQGWIGLAHIDPYAAQLMDSFHRLSIEQHGGLLNAWFWIDQNKNHRIDLEEFIQRCGDMGFAGDARQLFHYLKRDMSRQYLTLQDFDEDSMRCLYRGDLAMMTSTSPKQKHGHSPMSTQSTLSPGLSPQSLRDGEGDTSMPPIASLSVPSAAVEIKNTLASLTDTGSSFRLRECHQSTLNSRWTRQQSDEQMRARSEMKRKKDELDKGMKSLAGLKRELVKRFGSIFAAWRQGLDLDGNNRISFGEFCIALRNLGYGGNVKDVWTALDQDKDGFIGLAELDPKLAEELGSYRKAALTKYPNMLAVWKESVNRGGSGHVDEVTFMNHCKEIAWSGCARSLFSNLKEEKMRHFLTLRDYDIRAWNALNRGDMDMLSEEKPSADMLRSRSMMNFYTRQEQSFSQRWRRMNSKLERNDTMRNTSEAKAMDVGATSVQSLRNLLLRRFGTMSSAWRNSLDVNGNGKLAFSEFCSVMRQLGFSGDIRRIFDDLDSDRKGHITLKDLDLEAHLAIKEFRTLLLEKFGTYIKAWQAMDTNRNGYLEEEEMINTCKRIGFAGDGKQLFRYLLEGPGKRSITMADLDPAAMQAYWRGDLEAMSPLEKAKAALEARKKADQDMKARRMHACEWTDMKKGLIRKYGSIVAGWRNGLDLVGNGKVSFHEFSKAARSIGFAGNIRKTFNELDTNQNGIITLNEVDPESYQKLSRFQELLHGKYSSYENAWKSLDANCNGILELSEFDKVCQDIGYAYSSKALFQQLLTSPAKKVLSFEDVESVSHIILANKSDPNSLLVFYRSDADKMTHDERAKADLENRQQEIKKMKSMNVGSNDWCSFKDHLIAKFGTIFAAWRHGLNKHGKGKLSFTEFSAACREHGFTGNIGQMFQELDIDGRGVITFKEIDKDCFTKLNAFQENFLRRYGSQEEAWQVVDSNRSGVLEYPLFVNVCNEVGSSGDAKVLFKQLLCNQNRKSLTPEDIDSVITLSKAAMASSSKGFVDSNWQKRSA